MYSHLLACEIHFPEHGFILIDVWDIKEGSHIGTFDKDSKEIPFCHICKTMTEFKAEANDRNARWGFNRIW